MSGEKDGEIVNTTDTSIRFWEMSQQQWWREGVEPELIFHDYQYISEFGVFISQSWDIEDLVAYLLGKSYE